MLKRSAGAAALVCAALLLSALAQPCAGAQETHPGAVVEFLFGRADPAANLPDPDPEPPPSMQPGYKPDPWTQWDVPGRMRRFSGRIHAGLANFMRDSFAFKTADRPSLTPSSEIVFMGDLWRGNTVSFSAEGTVHFTPLFGLTAELSWDSFRREVSPPAIFITYTDSTHNQRLVNAGDVNLLRFVACARIDLPAYKALFKPWDLMVFDGAPEKSGFVPFIELGGGVTVINTVDVSVSVTDGASITTVKRTLYERSFNPAALFGAGLEYRIGLFGIYAKFTYAWNGKPLSGFAPYTDSAGALSTYQFNLGAAAYF